MLYIQLLSLELINVSGLLSPELTTNIKLLNLVLLSTRLLLSLKLVMDTMTLASDLLSPELKMNIRLHSPELIIANQLFSLELTMNINLLNVKLKTIRAELPSLKIIKMLFANFVDASVGSTPTFATALSGTTISLALFA
mmetsp:Transcript_85572/g.215818  ORF Transcript_85572/g.215818 Transcript_85572/m.215818 type:complete len:140 (+) Transcript_85572:575-994(+)